MPLARAEYGSAGYVYGTDVFTLDGQQGTVPATGLALSPTAWCVPTVSRHGQAYSPTRWIEPSNYSNWDQDPTGEDAASLFYGGGASGIYSSLSTPINNREQGYKGVAYIYEYS